MSDRPAQLVRIEKPVYGGACLARIEGKAVFVPLSLPGEEVRIHILEDKGGYAQAEINAIVDASPDRIVPGCQHFGICGGCHYQHADYATQLAIKQAILRETLKRGGVCAPEVIEVLVGEQWGYRNRIRLAFNAQGEIGYRGRRSHAVVPIAECPIAAPVLLEAAKAVTEVTRQIAPRLRPTELALFCNAEETTILASLFIRQAERIPFDDIARLSAVRIPAIKGFELLVEENRVREPRWAGSWGDKALLYLASGFDYRVDQGAFFQVNLELVDALVERVTTGRSGKLAWDLFAGVGLFAHKLAGSFAKVEAVESDPAALPGLTANLKGTSGTAVRSDTLQFLRQRVGKARPELIVVDPPRTGLGKDITQLLAEVAAPELVYISCDPATLARDLKMLLAAGYKIGSVTLADLFPQTFHMETVVTLQRA
ncbi:MAG TPA: 23S rRNA (uracil(1939)-C(5))-methyltransferase RlmD [Terracidiphilus sp.]|jgi:23S rRNA (uracil1939-C5)-methyltransferase|nr:23S rRNA (uracil(1939)-C(5))-methyltransferase RlmD [Terracidiphilus sp.]